QLMAERIGKERLELVRDLDLEQVLLLAVEIQDPAARALAPDLPALEEIRRDLLDRPARRQALEENQRVFNARSLLRELDGHLESQIVSVVVRLVDEDVSRTLDRPGATMNENPGAEARQQEPDHGQHGDRAEATPAHRRGCAAITGRRRGRGGRSS